MKCKVSKVKGWPIFHFNFKTQFDMASTFVRMQEHYESPLCKYNYQYFSLDDYMDWYVKKNGTWDYFTKWAGFNIPSISVKSFYAIFSCNLRPKESWILEKLKSFKSWPGLFSDEEYYIICTIENYDYKDTFHHELRHSLFNLNEKYRSDVTYIVKKYKLKKFKKNLYKTGYKEPHFIDEINAYATEKHSWLEIKLTKEMKKMAKELNKIENKHFGKSLLSLLGDK